jgi:exopolyphosphatase/guanosine-5'-triphosphate,3'-diphosphate pyrophosphatase
MKAAVIDLGTNTFHLLIVEITAAGKWKTLDRERVYVNLASDGIDMLSEDVMQRGYQTMQHFRQRIDLHDVRNIVAVGTAALRQASNAKDFLENVERSTGIHVEVISGLREAELISKGVLTALPAMERPALIMDIGGGSVEMIFVLQNEILFRASYPVGVAVLYNTFHTQEPIGAGRLAEIDAYLDSTFEDLWKVVSVHSGTVLVGASGTFEVVEAVIEPGKNPEDPPYSIARPDQFTPMYKEIVRLNLEERFAHPYIPESRARYIVVAVHLIEYMLRRLSRDLFYISAYAMKEGLVVELSENI